MCRPKDNIHLTCFNVKGGVGFDFVAKIRDRQAKIEVIYEQCQLHTSCKYFLSCSKGSSHMSLVSHKKSYLVCAELSNL